MEIFRIKGNTRCYLGVEEYPSESPRGLAYLRIRLHGEFWGFEENETGHFEQYLIRKAQEFDWIIADLCDLKLYTDNGPVLIRALTKHLNNKGGDAAVCSPTSPHIRQVLNIAQYEYFETEADAVAHFEEQAF